MEKIRRDVFRYGAELGDCSERSLVLVHPWFLGNFDGYKLEGFGDFVEGDYLHNLDSLIRDSFGRNVVLFEEYPKINVDSIAKKVMKIRGTDSGLYTVCTEAYDNFPKYSNWWDVFEALPRFNNGVDVAGGYVKGEKGEPGCCGDTLLKFEKRGIDSKFARGCCFN